MTTQYYIVRSASREIDWRYYTFCIYLLFVDAAGEYHFSNGDVYHGDWVEEMMEGAGKLTSADGETYEGELSAVSSILGFEWPQRRIIYFKMDNSSVITIYIIITFLFVEMKMATFFVVSDISSTIIIVLAFTVTLDIFIPFGPI